jgi:hypothetical protein
MAANPTAPLRGTTAIDQRFPLDTVSDQPPDTPGEPCPRCGSHGFNIHQRSWKSIRDPQVTRTEAIRYRCKRCGAVLRRYGDGVGPDRQSHAIKQLSVFLYCLGLSYQGTRDVLSDLGCALSPATIRKNVMGSHPHLIRSKPRLHRSGPGRLAGRNVQLSLRIAGIPTTSRWLEVTIEPGPEAADLSWQVTHCAEFLTDR